MRRIAIVLLIFSIISTGFSNFNIRAASIEMERNDETELFDPLSEIISDSASDVLSIAWLMDTYQVSEETIIHHLNEGYTLLELHQALQQGKEKGGFWLDYLREIAPSIEQQQKSLKQELEQTRRTQELLAKAEQSAGADTVTGAVYSDEEIAYEGLTVTDATYSPRMFSALSSSEYGTYDQTVVKRLEFKNDQAPFSINRENESISIQSGDLSLQYTDMMLPGRNGMSFALTRKYDSSRANFYDKDVAVYDVYNSVFLPEYNVRVVFAPYGNSLAPAGSFTMSDRFTYNYGGYSDTFTRVVGQSYPGDTAWSGNFYPIVTQGIIEEEIGKLATGTYKYREPGVDPALIDYRFSVTVRSTGIVVSLIAKMYPTGEIVFRNGSWVGQTARNITRTTENSPLGTGWDWDLPKIYTKRGHTYLRLEGGSTYEINSSNTLVGYPWKDITLTNNATVTVNGQKSSRVLTSIDGIQHYFTSDGLLIQKSDAFGNTLHFHYSNVSPYGKVLTKVIDILGNQIQISYSNTEVTITKGDRVVRYKKQKDSTSSKELLTSVIDEMNRTTRYTYAINTGSFNLLSNYNQPVQNYYALVNSVEHPSGAKTEYAYKQYNRKIGKESENENVYRVSSRQDAVYKTDGTVSRTNRITFAGEDTTYGSSTTYQTTANDGRITTTYTIKKQYINENTPSVYYNTNIVQQANSSNPVEKTTISQTFDETRKLPTPLQITKVTSNGTSNASAVVVSRTYDDYGNMTSETDPNNIKTTYTYDTQTNLLKSISKPIRSGQTLYTQYDRNSPQNNIRQVTTRQNNASGAVLAQTNFTYDTHGNPTAVTIKDDNRNIVVNFEYGTAYNAGFPTRQWVVATGADSTSQTIAQEFEYNKITGEMTKFIDGNGKSYTTTYQYDKLGRITKVTHPDSSFDSWTYNDAKNEMTTVDSTGVTSRIKWNELGWKVSEGIVGKSTLTYGYDTYGRMIWSEDGAGNRTTYQYDRWDRLTRTNYPGSDQAYSQFVYNDINRTVQSYDGERNRVVETYDAIGRLMSQQSYNSSGALASAATYTHDYVGNVLTMKDGKNQTTTYTYDVLGRLVNVLDPLGNRTSYKYSLANELTEILYPDQNKLTKQYDQMGRLIRRIDPSGAQDIYTYDANSNLIKAVNRKGQTHTYTYNNRDFLIESVTGDETVRFAYDTAGRRLQMTDATGITKYAYELASGWLRTVTFPDNQKIEYVYDSRGNRTRMTDPFGIVTTYQYDVNSRLQSVGPSATNQDATYTYRKNSQLSSITQKNGVQSQFGYNGLNLSSLTHKRSNVTSLPTFSYVHDVNRNITEKTDNGKHTFTYDALNRISTSSQFNENYTYDSRGNRRTMQSEKPFIMDESRYTYDQRDRLKSVEKSDGTQVAYKYNGDGLLVERTGSGKTTRYYYDGAHIIAEANVASGIVTHVASYVRGNGNQLVARVDGNGSRTYYVHNGHGDVVGLTNSAGNPINTYTYDIWGNPQTTVEEISNPFRYSGEYWDATTGLQYLRARWYDPALGRFINEDSYEGDISNPLTLNLYTYVMNNPLIFIDPSGHKAACTSESACRQLSERIKAMQENFAFKLANGGYQSIDDMVPDFAKIVAAQDGFYDELDEDEHFLYFKLAQIKLFGAEEAGFQLSQAEVTALAVGGFGLGRYVSNKAVNLPSHKKINIDIDHIISGHTKNGARATQSGTKDLFPDHMTNSQISKAVRDAYRNSSKIQTQGERVLVQGKSNGLTIEMWVNTRSKTIETAYPIFK